MQIKLNYQKDINIPDWLLQELQGNRLLAGLISQRGLDTPEKVREFLDPSLYKAASPFDFPDMEGAVQLILDTVQKGGKICIYGDYDVDGVVSTVILMELLKKIGGEAQYHLPDRFTEGYGMNKGVIQNLAQEIELIVTCDCGISNYEEIALAEELGLKVIITDHHQLPDKLPPADFIITPKLLAEEHQAFNIPGAGMVYFLARAVLSKMGREEESKEFLELLALAIVADVVPLRGENRFLLQEGLPLLADPLHTGLIQLLKTAGISDPQNITEEDIAFRIAPMINSAGRIERADLAVELLLSDKEFTAEKYAVELEILNKRRKKLQNELIDEVVELLEGSSYRKPIVIYQPHWHQGVIGIAAGRLSEEYQVPVLLMCQKENQEIITGSARSIPGIDIYQELKRCEKYLAKYGGHAGAAGFSLEREQLTFFIKSITAFLAERLTEKKEEKIIDIDGELPIDRIGLEDYFELRKLAPFGEGNPVPRFVSYSTNLIHSRPIGQDRHLRLIFEKAGVQHPAVWWWAGQKTLPGKLDLIYSPGLNEFQGKRELQLLVEEVIIPGGKRDGIVEVEGIEEDRVIKGAVPDFELVDLRNWEKRGENLTLLEGAAYYYEDLKEKRERETINRYQSTGSRTLVLLTCPPSLEILQEMVYANRPSRLVLAYSESKREGRAFIRELSGLIKYTINRKNGQLDLYHLAAKTGELESTIIAGLQYLEARGFITLHSFNPRFYIIKTGGEVKKGELKIKEKELTELIRESISFRMYLQEIEPDKIYELFTGKHGQ